MKYHPIYVAGPDDMRGLVEEMKEVCRNDPDVEESSYSSDVETAFRRTKQAADDPEFRDSGHIRLLVMPGVAPQGAIPVTGAPIPVVPVTVVLTLDKFEDQPQWDLSCSTPAIPPGEPLRVGDQQVAILLAGFFGGGGREIPPKGAFKAVRQFVAPVQ